MRAVTVPLSALRLSPEVVGRAADTDGRSTSRPQANSESSGHKNRRDQTGWILRDRIPIPRRIVGNPDVEMVGFWRYSLDSLNECLNRLGCHDRSTSGTDRQLSERHVCAELPLGWQRAEEPPRCPISRGRSGNGGLFANRPLPTCWGRWWSVQMRLGRRRLRRMGRKSLASNLPLNGTSVRATQETEATRSGSRVGAVSRRFSGGTRLRIHKPSPEAAAISRSAADVHWSPTSCPWRFADACHQC